MKILQRQCSVCGRHGGLAASAGAAGGTAAYTSVIFERHESMPISRGSEPLMAGFPPVAQST